MTTSTHFQQSTAKPSDLSTQRAAARNSSSGFSVESGALGLPHQTPPEETRSPCAVTPTSSASPTRATANTTQSTSSSPGGAFTTLPKDSSDVDCDSKSQLNPHTFSSQYKSSCFQQSKAKTSDLSSQRAAAINSATGLSDDSVVPGAPHHTPPEETRSPCAVTPTSSSPTRATVNTTQSTSSSPSGVSTTLPKDSSDVKCDDKSQVNPHILSIPYKSTAFQKSRANLSYLLTQRAVVRNWSSGLLDDSRARGSPHYTPYEETRPRCAVTPTSSSPTRSSTNTTSTSPSGVSTTLPKDSSDVDCDALRPFTSSPATKSSSTLSVSTFSPGHMGEALRQAAKEGKESKVRRLLESGADVNSQHINGLTALHWSAHEGHAKVLSLLLGNEAQVNVPDRHGWTALHCAVERNRKTCVKLLIEGGANVDATDEDGWAPLHMAANCSFVAIARMLVTAGASMEKQNSSEEMSPDLSPIRKVIADSRHNQLNFATKHLKLSNTDRNTPVIRSLRIPPEEPARKPPVRDDETAKQTTATGFKQTTKIRHRAKVMESHAAV